MTAQKSQPSAIPPWFDRAIRTGIARLYALGFERCPAADMLEATVQVWAEDLWDLRAGTWVEADAARFDEAFYRLRTRQRVWPQMADLIAALPSRPEPVALPAVVLTEEQQQRNKERVDSICAELARRMAP